MFEFTLDEQSLAFFQKNLSEDLESEINFGLERIWQRFGAELERQRRTSGDGYWEPLEPEYWKRKEKSFPNRGMLDRTGFMMLGYLNGISIDYVNYTVTVPFPTGKDRFGHDVAIRAKSHQGVIGQPKGVEERPFNLEPLEDIAVDVMREALAKGVENANKVKPRRSNRRR